MLDIDNLIEECAKKFSSFDRNETQHRYLGINLPLQAIINLIPHSQIDYAYYWHRPYEEYRATGLGKLYYRTAQGNSRFKQLQHYYLQYCHQWPAAPVACIAFAFDAEDEMLSEWSAIPNALLSVPRILIESNQGSNSITFNIELDIELQPQLDEYKRLLESLSDNPAPDIGPVGGQRCTVNDTDNADYVDNKKNWSEVAEKAIEAIRQKKFRKLVVSRKHFCELNSPINTRSLLPALANRYPGCTIISYVDGGSQFISVTPERLLSLSAGCLQSDAIGGTLNEDEAAQYSGVTDAQSILATKLKEEHGIIVEDICRRLEPVCNSLTLPSVPKLKKLHNIYHLETPVSGKLNSNQTVLSLTEQLHPTPAIAGFPSAESVRWLRDNEKHRRGWYAGAFGLMRGDQNGEVSVLLRCALFDQTAVNVYAGAGLVAESDVDMEWQETELKMSAILDLFQG